MVYDKSDRWLYRPVSCRIERLCNRSSETESKFTPAVTKKPGVADVQSVSISHRSDGKNSCDYYYSRAENVGLEKNRTVTEKHSRVVDDGTMPYAWKNRVSDDDWWNLRTTQSLIRNHRLSLKPW